jgi:hypothetical protein
MEIEAGFPAIPNVNAFANLGLNTRPTFSGCDASNATKTSPLIVSPEHGAGKGLVKPSASYFEITQHYTRVTSFK